MNDPFNKQSAGTDSNPDLITGEPGSHPVGTGVGAATGGATGAAIGAVAGPVGVVVGAAIGAVAGGLAGKGVAESIDPTVHDAYWQQNHASQPYAANGSYDQYRGAYRTGYEGVGRHGANKDFSEVEGDLKSSYEQAKDKSAVTWEHAKDATPRGLRPRQGFRQVRLTTTSNPPYGKSRRFTFHVALRRFSSRRSLPGSHHHLCLAPHKSNICSGPSSSSSSFSGSQVSSSMLGAV